MDRINTDNKVVDINLVKPNTFNPKPDYNETEELKSEYQKIVDNISKQGQIGAVKVRRVANEYEIIDGFHRWNAMKELGYNEIEIKDLGEISREEAIVLSLNYERTNIPIDVIEEAKLIRELKEINEGLLSDLPFTESEIKDKIDMLEFDFDGFKDIEVIEENENEIKALESKKRYYFSFDNSEDLNKVLDFFETKSGKRLDNKKLVSIIDNGTE